MKHVLTTLFIFTLLAIPLQSHAAIPPAILPQTGQTLCYDSGGATIACSGTGQDGESQAGMQWPTPRFVDNGDQTVTDKLSGLVWTKDANIMTTRNPTFDQDYVSSYSFESLKDGSVSWQHALDYIKVLNTEFYLGHNDWRLPNINELESLFDYGQKLPATWYGFINMYYNIYWSSSTSADRTNLAWYFFADSGYRYPSLKSFNSKVWPVRSGQLGTFASLSLPKTGQIACYDVSGATISCSGTGQDGELQIGEAWPNPRFVDNNDQSVTDKLTGVIWSKNANPGVTTFTWQEALDYIKSLNSSNYLGYNDWHIPNNKEMASIVNQGNTTVSFLSGQAFTNVQANRYWSATTHVQAAGSAWDVDLSDNHMAYFSKGYKYYVWPVRSGQYWSFDYLSLSLAVLVKQFNQPISRH